MTILWEKQILCTFALRTADTKTEVIVLDILRPLISSRKTLSKRFSFAAFVFCFFDLIKLVCESIKVLGFHYLIDFFRCEAVFAKSTVTIDIFNVCNQTRMHNSDPWFVSVGHSILLDMLWGTLSLYGIKIRSHTLLRVIVATLWYEAGGNNSFKGVRSASHLL